MPKEIRQISFTAGELVLAITDYHRRRNLPLPAGHVIRVQIVSDPDIRAALFVQNDLAGIVELGIGSEMLAAALILFCINRRIPLPAESDKRLQRLGDEEVALLVIRRNDR
jgi:hypothetical protein